MSSLVNSYAYDHAAVEINIIVLRTHCAYHSAAVGIRITVRSCVVTGLASLSASG